MKKILVSVCLGASLLLIFGCKKENNLISNSLQGLWELRQTSGMLTTIYPHGNGHTIKFSGNSFEISSNGQTTQSGQYEIKRDLTAGSETCLVIPAGQYTNRIVYHNNTTNQKKIFLQILDNKLILLSGCFAIDAGSSNEYARQ